MMPQPAPSVLTTVLSAPCREVSAYIQGMMVSFTESGAEIDH